jgi:hypothetical protein
MLDLKSVVFKVAVLPLQSRKFAPKRRQELWCNTISATRCNTAVYHAATGLHQSPPRWSSTRHLWRINSKRRSTLLELYMTCTSNRSMRNSGHGRFGVSLTHSLPRSNNRVQFRILRPRRSSVNSWKRAFHNRSDLRGGTGRAAPAESSSSEVSSVKVAGLTDMPRILCWQALRHDTELAGYNLRKA